MTDIEHIKIYDSHSELLHKLDKNISILLTVNENNEKKLDSLESRMDNLIGSHTGDIKDISILIRKELEKVEARFQLNINKIEKKIDDTNYDLEKTNDKLAEIEKFKSELSGKIYGAATILAVVFSIFTFIINKFL